MSVCASLRSDPVAERVRAGVLAGGLGLLLAAWPGSARAQESGALLVGPPPPPPSDLSATPVSSTRIDLAWSEVVDDDDDEEVVAYRIYRDNVRIASTSDTEFADTGLQSSTTYTYAVSAVDDKGREGSRSSPVSATTLADDTPPTPPGDLTATAVSPTQIDLSWSAAEDPESGVAEYRVYRDGTLAGSTTETSFADVGLQPETTYRYQVTAVNGEGLEGPPSGEAQATTPVQVDTVPPAPPTGLRIVE